MTPDQLDALGRELGELAVNNDVTMAVFIVLDTDGNLLLYPHANNVFAEAAVNSITIPLMQTIHDCRERCNAAMNNAAEWR